MSDTTFGIQIDDGSHSISQYAGTQNRMCVELHEWQKEALKLFLKWKIGIFECCTGSGKSFAAITIMKKLEETNRDLPVLIIVPKNVILEDTWFKELYLNGYTVKDIGLWYGKFKEQRRITITNMQSVDGLKLHDFEKGLCIIDEVHHSVGKSMKEVMNSPFAYKLGLSATVDRLDEKHWNLLKQFRYNIYKYSPKQALYDKVVNDFNFTNVSVSMDPESFDKYMELEKELSMITHSCGGVMRALRLPAGDPRKSAVLSLMNKRKDFVVNYHKKFDVVAGICKNHDGDKILVFNEYNKTTTNLYYRLLEHGMSSKIIHSGMKSVQREKNLDDYTNDKFRVLLATKILDEGYNLPAISVAVIMAGNSSAQQTIQRLGRCLRKKATPSELYQVYCKDTFEERHAEKRSKLFKELCSKYSEVEN